MSVIVEKDFLIFLVLVGSLLVYIYFFIDVMVCVGVKYGLSKDVVIKIVV